MPSEFESYWHERLDFLDVHYHASPDAYHRKFNAIEAGEAYKKLRGGVLLKSHLGCTAAVAATAQSLHLPVFGSVVLNTIAGGLDVRAIEQSLCYYQGIAQCGRLVVDLPTVVPTTHKSRLARVCANGAVERWAQAPCRIGDDSSVLFDAIDGLLDFCKDSDVVLTTGHATRAQVEALVNRCAKKGGVRLLLNQPANPMTNMDAAALKSLGEHDWLFVEQTALTYLLGYQTEEDFHDVLASVANLIYSSDLGQVDKMMPHEWRRHSHSWFEAARLSTARIRQISLFNPLRMLSP